MKRRTAVNYLTHMSLRVRVADRPRQTPIRAVLGAALWGVLIVLLLLILRSILKGFGL